VAEQYSDDRLASEALVELGVEWEAAGRWEEALRIYRELADRNGRLVEDPWPAVGKRRLRELVSPRVTQALQAQDDLEAVSLFQQYAVSSTGESLVGPELLLEIAGAHRRLGFTADAVKWYQAVIQDPSARPLWEAALIGLGASYLDQEDFDAARQVVERYRLQYPAGRWKAEALRVLAVAYQRKGDHWATIRTCRRWVQLYPTHPGRASVWLMLARALEGSEKTDEALKAYAEAERAGGFADRTDPTAATARLHYANLLIKAGRSDDAIRHLEALRRATSDQIQADWAAFQMARIRRAQAQYEKARALLQELTHTSADGLVGRVSGLMQADLPTEGRL
jgi:tetratricopeptide (TPR) repeat protein